VADLTPTDTTEDTELPDLDGTLVEATALDGTPDAVEGELASDAINPAGDNDIYTVEFTAGTPYLIWVDTGADLLCDTVLRIYPPGASTQATPNADGDVIAESDELIYRWSGSDPGLVFVPRDSGRFFLEVLDYYDSIGGTALGGDYCTYTLKAMRLEMGEQECNDESSVREALMQADTGDTGLPATATSPAIQAFQSSPFQTFAEHFSGMIDFDEDDDMWRFRFGQLEGIPGGHFWLFSLWQTHPSSALLPQRDYNLTLYDSQLRVLAQTNVAIPDGNFGFTEDAGILYPVTSNSTYYLQVTEQLEAPEDTDVETGDTGSSDTEDMGSSDTEDTGADEPDTVDTIDDTGLPIDSEDSATDDTGLPVDSTMDDTTDTGLIVDSTMDDTTDTGLIVDTGSDTGDLILDDTSDTAPVVDTGETGNADTSDTGAGTADSTTIDTSETGDTGDGLAMLTDPMPIPPWQQPFGQGWQPGVPGVGAPSYYLGVAHGYGNALVACDNIQEDPDSPRWMESEPNNEINEAQLMRFCQVGTTGLYVGSDPADGQPLPVRATRRGARRGNHPRDAVPLRRRRRLSRPRVLRHPAELRRRWCRGRSTPDAVHPGSLGRLLPAPGGLRLQQQRHELPAGLEHRRRGGACRGPAVEPRPHAAGHDPRRRRRRLHPRAAARLPPHPG
jgi:hypothetical protein